MDDGNGIVTLAANTSMLVGEKKAAEIIGLSARTLQQRRYMNQPPKYVRLPGTRSIRYRLSDLLNFIEKGVIDCEERSDDE